MWEKWCMYMYIRKVAGSIPDGVIGIFHWQNPSDRTMALGPTQPLTEIFPGGKSGRCLRLTTYHHSVPLSCNRETLTSWNSLVMSRPVMGLLYLYIHIYVGKAIPLQAWTGPEVSRRLRLPDFKTTAQDGGKVVSLTHWPPLPSGNTPCTHFC